MEEEGLNWVGRPRTRDDAGCTNVGRRFEAESDVRAGDELLAHPVGERRSGRKVGGGGGGKSAGGGGAPPPKSAGGIIIIVVAATIIIPSSASDHLRLEEREGGRKEGREAFPLFFFPGRFFEGVRCP